MKLTFAIPALPSAQCTAGKPVKSKPLKPKLIGYYTKGKTPNWHRSKEYDAWKDHVREVADLQGITVPEASREQPIRLDVTCYFPTNGGSDPENVRKGIVDALYRHRDGGDRWVYGYHHHPLCDQTNPRVEITITWGLE